jgi:hypothetical protein
VCAQPIDRTDTHDDDGNDDMSTAPPPPAFAARFTDLRLAIKRSSALLGMYEHSHNPEHLDEARRILAVADQPLRKPRIPAGQRDDEDVRRQRRDRKREQRLAELENGPDLYDDLAPDLDGVA